MAMRRCRHCPTLIPADAYRGMCEECRRAWDRARGTREERGYGADHKAEREQYAKLIRAGITVRCVTCNEPLSLDFHLGHAEDRASWIGPQCPVCNDSAAGKASHSSPLSTPRGGGRNP